MTVITALAALRRAFVGRRWWMTAPRSTPPTSRGHRVMEQYRHELKDAIANRTVLRCLITQVNVDEIIVRMSEAEDAPIGRMSGEEFDERDYKGYEGFVGRIVEVVVLSYDPDRRVAEVSRRLAREILAAQLMPTLRLGQTVRGTVWVIQPFGAFIDLGGIHALLPVNEISHTYVNHPGEILTRGEELDVRIIGLDPAARKIRVSLKATIDPWATLSERYSAHDFVLGTVSGMRDELVWVRPNQYFGLEVLCPLPGRRALEMGASVVVRLNVADPVTKRLRGRIIRVGP